MQGAYPMTRFTFLMISAMLLVLASCASSRESKRRENVRLPAPVVTSIREVRMADGTVVPIPQPALWPGEATRTQEFREWAQAGCIRTLQYRDAEGYTYVGEFEFLFTEPNDPQLYAMLRRITRFRPDGTKEVVTDYGPRPLDGWTTYSPDGQRKVMHVNQMFSIDGSIRLRVELYDAQEHGRGYEVLADGMLLASD